MAHPDLHLLRRAGQPDAVEALAIRLGGRVGLAGVLGDLNRVARPVRVPAPAASWGFRWDEQDTRSVRWWPQGITTAADAGDPAELEGRAVLVTSAYSRVVDGLHMGSRLSFVDLTDRGSVRYRHVLLVEAVLRDGGEIDLRPVKVHAGGIVWHGGHVHVAGTAQGFRSFRLEDIMSVPAGGDPSRLRAPGRPGDTAHAFGYRYVLPVRFSYEAHAGEGWEPMRYSFASVDRSATPHELVAGEYGRAGMTTRLARYEMDPTTSLLRTDADGRAVPVALHDGGVRHMQGATVVRGTWFVTTSRGRYRLGSVWVGRPGALREHRRELPVGPEDITFWPSRDELWSLTEHPPHRYVFAMPRRRFVDDDPA